MAVKDAESAEASVREWIQKKFGTPGENVYFESARKEASNWLLDVQFMIAGYRKYYSMTVDGDSGAVTGYNEKYRPFNFPPFIPPPRNTGNLLLLAALIISVIVVIVFVIQGIVNLIGGVFDIYSGVLGGIGHVVLGVFLLAFGVIDIYLTVEINTMRELADRGDLKGALSRNTLTMGVICIIFDGVVPGILLIVAREELLRQDRMEQSKQAS